MSEKEILDILLEFKEHLSQGWIIQDVFRSLGWIIILGLGWLVESLENITDSILGLKSFFAESDVSSFMNYLKPLSIILMAFSLLFTGYKLIFQKKIDREGIIINIFLALVVITLLGTGMEKANKFTDDAIGAVNEDANASLANNVIKQGLLDIALYDLQGWEKPDIDPKNNIPTENIRDIDINAYLTDGSMITSEGTDILSYKIDTLGDGTHGVTELDDGNFITDITKEYYYRYTVDWFTVMVTLAITAFTLLTIAVKLAKLFFELTFNYVLAVIIAPADIHSGQKTKHVIQNILSIFLVTIMIFLSMKIYIMGTAFIEENLTGLSYLIALFAFSLAVIDGPNIVERLFGIDAGLKSGWGALAGAYAGAKGISKGVQGLSSAGKSAALKGLGGVAGASGMAKGLIGSKNQEQDQNQNKQQNEQNASTNAKGGNQALDNKGNNENATGENAQIDNKQNVEENSEAENELSTGKQQAASSLEQEMKQQNGSNSNKQHSSTPNGLHAEMANKGYQSQPSLSTTATNQGGRMANSQSRMNPVSSGTSSPAGVTNISTENQMSSIPSGSTSSTSGGESVENVVVNSSSNSSPISGSTSSNHSPSVSHSSTPIGDTAQQPVRETRHVGNVVSDNVRQNKTVKHVQRSYQIGQNTGESVRRKITKFSRRNQK